MIGFLTFGEGLTRCLTHIQYSVSTSHCAPSLAVGLPEGQGHATGHVASRTLFVRLGSHSIASCPRHFLRHVQQQPTVRVLHATEQGTEVTEGACIFPCASPVHLARTLLLRKTWRHSGFFTIVEHLVKRNFQGAREFLKRLDSRNGVSVFDTRDV